ncbi:MAG: hypothetical protein ABL973_00430 [Micropepsaceae bacterium]
MLSIHAKPDLVERRRKGPVIFAVFSYRYDAHLVPGMLQNISPMVDGWVAYDDRNSRDIFSDEPHRRQLLVSAARDAGADWILAIDPDERFERRLASAIRPMTAGNEYVAFSFPIRELYAPHAYRVDGIWGRKAQTRLLRVPPAIEKSPMFLHSPWHAISPGIEVRVAEFNIYHLKMITPERRRARRDLYNHLDPKGTQQAIGYDYLADETGLELENIPVHKFYDPPYEEDNGLWMPDMAAKD